MARRPLTSLGAQSASGHRKKGRQEVRMTGRAMDDSDVKSPSIQGGAGPAGGGRWELKKAVWGQPPQDTPGGPGHQSPAKPGPS